MYNGWTPTPTNPERKEYDAMQEQAILGKFLAMEFSQQHPITDVDAFLLNGNMLRCEFDPAHVAKSVNFPSSDTDPRISRRDNILYALENEPVARENAMELISELAEIDASLGRNSPEFGSPEWFDGIKEVKF